MQQMISEIGLCSSGMEMFALRVKLNGGQANTWALTNVIFFKFKAPVEVSK